MSRGKWWVNLLVIILFFAALELLREEPAALAQFMPYVFHGLMVISAFMAVFAVGVVIVLWWADEEAQSDGAINQFMFAGILFCLAAIAAKLWGGFSA